MMFLKAKNKEESPGFRRQFAISAAVIVTLALCGLASAAAVKQKSFASAEEAVKAIVTAAKSDDNKELLAILGPAGKELISSGDAVADKQRRTQFLKAYDEKNRLTKKGDDVIVLIGKDDWPFPIPVVKKGDSWVFDTEKGKEEILNRRIGENELNAIQVCLAIVDAQREYARKDRDKNGLLEYAQKFKSDPGKKNGLYWESKSGEEQSPLGPFVEQARGQGYQGQQSSGKPPPYHGYQYRILKAQGKNAPGGVYDYVVKGKMIGGFAIVAYPAQYGNSGVMTFIVNHDGVVYQKDLGRNTEKVAQAMSKFDPDASWKKVEDTTKR